MHFRAKQVELFTTKWFGKGFHLLEGSAILVGRFRTRRIFYWPQTCQNPQSKIAKIMIFWNILKIYLKGLWYRFRVHNSSKTPQVFIYDHVSCTRPLPAELWKIDFLAKIVILAILKHMWPCIFWQSICPEGVINVICDWGFSKSPGYLHKPWMTSYDDYNNF